MTIDRVVALGARDDWLFLVAKWPELRNRLRPGGGNALSGMPSGGGDATLPIDVHVSDLLEEITQSARFYANVLINETADHPITTSHMPRLLTQVAVRYGHFTEAEDEQIGLAFCDDASDYREKVRKTLERPAPPTYVGPCQHKGDDEAGCTGELYLREGRDAGTCRVCGEPFTLAEQREFLNRELDSRLMTASEIVRALKILGHDVKPGTVRSWISRGHLNEVTDGLYLIRDAQELVKRPYRSA